MSEFDLAPHPRTLHNLTAVVEEVAAVTWDADGETVSVQLRTETAVEGFSVPVTLTFDADQFAQVFNRSLRKA